MTREELLAKKKAYRESHKEAIRAYRIAHREEIQEQRRGYRVTNHQRILEGRRAWEEVNKDKIRMYRLSRRDIKNQREKERMKTDVNFAITKRLRGRFRAALRQGAKVGSAIQDLGCSIDEFKKYIESKFQDGMTWDNREEWHLDHIIPLSKFNLQNQEQVKIALHYSNYQPMWAMDNIAKNDLHVMDFRGGMF